METLSLMSMELNDELPLGEDGSNWDWGPESGQIAQVRPEIYVGSRRAAEDKTGLKLRGIKSVVNVRHEGLQVKVESVEYFQVSISDESDADLLSELPRVLELLREAKRPILIACRAGVSRSVSVVVALLMAFEGLDLHQAIKAVQSVRSKAQPRRSFVEQLSLFHIMNFSLRLPNSRLHPLYRLFCLRNWVLKKLRWMDPGRRENLEGVIYGGFFQPNTAAPVSPEKPSVDDELFEQSPPLEEIEWLASQIHNDEEESVLCGRCHRPFLPASAVIPHDEATRPTLYDRHCGGPDLPCIFTHRYYRPNWQSPDGLNGSSLKCVVEKSQVYVLPTTEMLSVATAWEGLIKCSACDEVLGTYSWRLGLCLAPDCPLEESCRRPIFPAFRLRKSSLILPSLGDSPDLIDLQ